MYDSLFPLRRIARNLPFVPPCLLLLVLTALLLASVQPLSARSWQRRAPAPRLCQPTCQTTRLETSVALLHDPQQAVAAGFDSTYTGRGVLVGIIDTGIEYNHLNFRDPQTGHTRLRGAVLYREEEGSADEVRDYYDDPLQLDTLTTDTHHNAHGTHTAGVAAGSYPGLGLQGMAPEADLMLCGTSALTDERLIDAMRCTFDRADELGLPCVINLSVGNPVDWKDGLTPFCHACDSLTDGGRAPGRIIVVSSGNDGAKAFGAKHRFTDEEPVYALLQPLSSWGLSFYFNPNVDVYCDDDQPLQLDFVLYDTLQHSFEPCPFEQHLLDTLEVSHEGRRHLCLDTDTCQMKHYPNCLLAARFQGCRGSSMTAYYLNDMSVNYNILPGPDDRWLSGSTAHSINDLCCTDAVLSVGAYSAVDSVVNIFGRPSAALARRGEVCAFSSYGLTWQGVPKPDCVCPGASVVSSFSSFWEDKVTYYTDSRRYPGSPMMHIVTPEPDEAPWYRPDEPFRTYYWIHAVGTSQSSPVLAGIIALWLEADPTLSVGDVRSILQQTSRFDDQCLRAPIDVMQAGSGKADAAAGMREVLARRQSITPVLSDGDVADGPCYDLFGRRVASDRMGRQPMIRGGRLVVKPAAW